MAKRNKKRNKQCLTRREYDRANGDPGKMPTITKKQEEIAARQEENEKEAAAEMHNDGIEIDGVLFYAPTIRHRSFFRTIAHRYLADLGVLYNLAAYIRSVPSEKVNTTLYTQKLNGTLELEAFNCVCDLDHIQVQLIADELMEGIIKIEDNKADDDDDSEEDNETDSKKS